MQQTCNNIKAIYETLCRKTSDFERLFESVKVSGDLQQAQKHHDQLAHEMKEFKDLVVEAMDQIELRESVARECHYAYVGKFSEQGIARAQSKEIPHLWYLIRKDGTKITKGEEYYIHPQSENLWGISYQFQTIVNFLDSAGRRIFEDSRTIQWLEDCHDGYIIMVRSRPFRTNYVNVLGEDVFSDRRFFIVSSFSEDVAGVTELSLNKACYIDHAGKIISELGFYDRTCPFKDGFAPVCLDGVWFFINKKGERQTQLGVWNWANAFSCGFASVQKNGFYYFIDREGKQLNKEGFVYAQNFMDGFAVVQEQENSSFFLIDIKGKKQEQIGNFTIHRRPTGQHEDSNEDKRPPVQQEGVMRIQRTFSDPVHYLTKTGRVIFRR